MTFITFVIPLYILQFVTFLTSVFQIFKMDFDSGEMDFDSTALRLSLTVYRYRLVVGIPCIRQETAGSYSPYIMYETEIIYSVFLIPVAKAIPSPDLWPSPRAMSCGTKTKKINNHPYSLKVSNKKSAQSKNNNYILIMYVEVDS